MTEQPNTNENKNPKVFGIGFHKTGTSTLAEVLKIFGYSVTGSNWSTQEDIADTYVERCKERSKRFDGFQDNPWPLVYAEMDAMWPGSKFILTTRDADKWVASQVKHFGRHETPMRRFIYGEEYGFPAGNEAHYKKVFNDHIDAVRSHFEGRPEDFLEIDLTAGLGWDPICEFLGRDIPATPFPHANSAKQRAQGVPLWRRVAKQIIRRS